MHSFSCCLQLPTPFPYLPLVSFLSSLVTGRTILSSFPASASVWLNSVHTFVSFTSFPRKPKGLTLLLSLSYWRKGALDLAPELARSGLRFDSEVKAQRVGVCERKPQACLGDSPPGPGCRGRGSLSQTPSLCCILSPASPLTV